LQIHQPQVLPLYFAAIKKNPASESPVGQRISVQV
jgi:hypothetical protein